MLSEKKKVVYLLSNLLVEGEAGQDGQGEDHHRQAVVGQEGDQRPIEGFHRVLRRKPVSQSGNQSTTQPVTSQPVSLAASPGT